MTVRTRFAPSPTGPLHLGHAFSALIAERIARASGGLFLLRIDDLDRSRARPEWEAAIKRDLAWLGLDWPEPCRRQSDCGGEYDAALDALWSRGLLYPCSCTRRDIREAASAPQEGAPLQGPDGLVYPGTCRPVTPPSGPRPDGVTLRLDMRRATAESGRFDAAGGAAFHENLHAKAVSQRVHYTQETLIREVGDVVLSRANGAAYHLAVAVDDHAQEITDVVRGADLLDATMIHELLRALLYPSAPALRYHHHRLIRDDSGKRLAKRDDARALETYRARGVTPSGLRDLLGISAPEP